MTGVRPDPPVCVWMIMNIGVFGMTYPLAALKVQFVDLPSMLIDIAVGVHVMV